MRMHTIMKRVRGDRGVTMPMLAISLFALLAVASLVLDGGQAYSQRRQMQNAADAAAMAGAGALDDVRLGPAPRPPATFVQETVDRVAAENGAEEVLSCTIVNGDGDPLGPCTDTTLITTNSAAVGVSVKPRDVRSTTFAMVIGVDEMAATADATATIQPIVGGKAPWAICSSGVKYDFLDANYKVDPVKAAALGEIVIQGSQAYKDDNSCDAKTGGGGGGASFKGKIGSPYVQVGESTIAPNDPGNALPSGWEDFLVPCPVAPKTTDCALLPVAYKVEGVGGGAEIFVSDFAYWRLREGHTGVDQMYGTFVAPAGPGAITPGTTTGTGEPLPSSARAVALIE